jgi:hypothetical protein
MHHSLFLHQAKKKQVTPAKARPLHQKINLETTPQAAASPQAHLITENPLDDFETPCNPASQTLTEILVSKVKFGDPLTCKAAMKHAKAKKQLMSNSTH